MINKSIATERYKVLDGIINQSKKIVEQLGDCSQKPSLKASDVRKGNYDLLFYDASGTPKSKKDLEEIKKQHTRNISWCEQEKQQEI